MKDYAKWIGIIILFVLWWPLGLIALIVYLRTPKIKWIFNQAVDKYNESQQSFVNEKLDDIENDIDNFELNREP